MYFVEQFKKQIQSAFCSSIDPEGRSQGLQETVKNTAESGPASPDDVKTGIEALRKQGEAMSKKSADFWEQRGRISSPPEAKVAGTEGEKSGGESQETKKEIPPVTTKEALSSVKPVTAEENQLAAMMGKNDATPEQIQQAIYESRLKQMASNEISDADKKVIEATFINDIAKETGVDPKLMADMRALGFEGLQDGTPEEVAEKLRDFSEDMKLVNKFAENLGGELPKTKEEFIALYNKLKGPDGELQIPLTPEEATAMGLKLTPEGNIDPTTPGYEQNGDFVASGNGKPYSRGGQVFSGAPRGGNEGGGGGKALDLNNLPPGPEGLIKMITQAEAGGDYNIIYSGCSKKPPKPITQMTLTEVSDFQDEMVASGSASSAVGGIQVIRGTLDPYVEKYPNQVFDEAFQNKLITAKLVERKMPEFQRGEISEMQFMENISMEWASFPKDMSGASYYAGDGLNHALVSPEQVLAQLRTIKGGSIETSSLAA